MIGELAMRKINDLTHKHTRSERKETDRKRANKTAKVKWGRGKREANGK